MTFQGTLGWLDKELAKLEQKAAKLRQARAVLAEYAPGGAVAEVARKKPRRARKVKHPADARAVSQQVKATMARPAPHAPSRLTVIAARAAKPPVNGGKCDLCMKPSTVTAPCPKGCGRISRACAEHGGRSLGGRVGGHARKCKAKPASEPGPAAEPPVVAAVAPSARSWGGPGHVKGKSASDRLCRCTVLVANEFGSGGRGIVKQQPCGATVWANARQKHLHGEHGIIDPAIEGYFEALKDPEDADADAA